MQYIEYLKYMYTLKKIKIPTRKKNVQLTFNCSKIKGAGLSGIGGLLLLGSGSSNTNCFLLWLMVKRMQ